MDIIKIGKITPPQIEWNKETIAHDVRAALKDYKEWYDEASTVEDFQEIRKQLNKDLKSVNDKRKEIKRELTKPITEFEAFFKEQEALFQPIIDGCKKTIDEAEQTRINDKVEKIRQLEGFSYYKTFNQGVPAEWENKTYSLKKIQKDITEINEQTQSNVDTIKTTSKALDLENDKYIKQLANGFSVSDIVERMKEDKELLNKANKVETDHNDEVIVATIKVKGKKSVLNAMWKWAKNNGVEMEKVK